MTSPAPHEKTQTTREELLFTCKADVKLHSDMALGYNQALTDALSIVKEVYQINDKI